MAPDSWIWVCGILLFILHDNNVGGVTMPQIISIRNLKNTSEISDRKILKKILEKNTCII